MNKYQKQWQERNREKVRKYNRDFYWKNKSKESDRKKIYWINNREKIIARQKKWRSEHKNELRDYFRKYLSNPDNQKKANVRYYVWLAVKNGKIIKKACHCGNTKVEGHHIDYSKPLEVIWLCRKHHIEADKKLK